MYYKRDREQKVDCRRCKWHEGTTRVGFAIQELLSNKKNVIYLETVSSAIERSTWLWMTDSGGHPKEKQKRIENRERHRERKRFQRAVKLFSYFLSALYREGFCWLSSWVCVSILLENEVKRQKTTTYTAVVVVVEVVVEEDEMVGRNKRKYRRRKKKKERPLYFSTILFFLFLLLLLLHIFLLCGSISIIYARLGKELGPWSARLINDCGGHSPLSVRSTTSGCIQQCYLIGSHQFPRAVTRLRLLRFFLFVLRGVRLYATLYRYIDALTTSI